MCRLCDGTPNSDRKSAASGCSEDGREIQRAIDGSFKEAFTAVRRERRVGQGCSRRVVAE